MYCKINVCLNCVFPSFNGNHSNTAERKLHRFTRNNLFCKHTNIFSHLLPEGWRWESRCLCPRTHWSSDDAGRSFSSFCHTDSKIDEACVTRILSETVTGGLLDCSLFDIFMRVLDNARGKGGVKFPPLLVIPGALMSHLIHYPHDNVA